MEGIAERLSTKENLYFPRAIQEILAIDPSRTKSILLDLLTRDTAVFLERYGAELTSEELKEFEILKKDEDDYEVNWHLKNLRSLINPSLEEVRLQSIKIKNRRRAYLNKLVNDGNYFSEDAMREREPYLHHELLGKFQDPSGRSMVRPGEKWSETLMRRSEEAFLVEKIRGEQKRLGVDERDWIGNVREEQQEEEEEEEEEDDDDEGDDKEKMQVEDSHEHHTEVVGTEACNVTKSHQRITLSPAEMQDHIEQFTHIMQQKFLSGEDSQHLDYAKIDNDEALDDHWFREADHDAEEKYFADD